MLATGFVGLVVKGTVDVVAEVTGEVEETLVEETDELDRKSTRLNSSHSGESRMPSSA